AARARSAARLTAREVVGRIREHINAPWINPTADTFKFGDPERPVRGITTTFMCTFELLKKSLAAGNNFVITHEAPFWAESRMRSDREQSNLRDDPLYEEKLRFIQSNDMVIWQFHDHWHLKPDGILTGWNKALGWESYAV